MKERESSTIVIHVSPFNSKNIIINFKLSYQPTNFVNILAANANMLLSELI